MQIIHAVELKTREITSLSTAPKLICVDLDQGSFFLFLEFVSVVDFGLREIVVGVGCKVTNKKRNERSRRNPANQPCTQLYVYVNSFNP